MYPAANAEVGLGEGLPDYATVVADEAQGGEPARRKRILEILHDYDEAVQKAAAARIPKSPS